MKKTISRTLVSCAALAVIGGALIAPSLAAERETGGRTRTSAPTVTTLSASPASSGSSDIGEAEARAAALKQADVAEGDTSWIFAKRDYEDGRLEYEVEFLSGSWKYEVDVDAATGAVTGFDRDRKGRSRYAQAGTDIGAEKARTLALEHAGVEDALFLKTELDYEDGLRVYEVEFYAGGREYDYEIDAAEGTVLKFDYDIEWYTPAASDAECLSADQIKQIVEKTAGTTGVYTEFELDMDDGRLLYEGELRSGRMEYEFEIDACTGAILDWDADRD